LLGSFITGPAMTICALLLRHRFYSLNRRAAEIRNARPIRQYLRRRVLTQFASPPVVIVASVWNWIWRMLTHFG
jgi:hypothetical protein